MSKGAISARFVAFRTVPARGVFSLTLDVPVEEAEAAVALLGVPVIGASIHVGLCRLYGPGLDDGTVQDRNTAIHGTYEACRMVSGRGALALTIEMPAERGHQVLKVLGVPQPGVSLLVAIVPLRVEPTDHAEKPREAGALAVQQAALRPKDEAWQRWLLAEQYVEGDGRNNELAAIEAMRDQLGIRSRAELRSDPEKLAEWHAMVRRFENHIQGGGNAGEV